MTKVQNPIIGRSRGSAGGMTFSKSLGKNIMRAKAFEVNNPKTAAQTTQRNFFTQVSDLVAGFSPNQLRTLFPTLPKGITRRNALFKQIAAENQTVDDVKSVKLADVVTLGNAPTMDFGTTTCTNTAGTIAVELDAAVKANVSVKDYYFVAVVVNETKSDMIMPAVTNKVETGTLSITAPDSWETADTIHAIPLILDDKGGKIALVGFGTLSVATRPERN